MDLHDARRYDMGHPLGISYGEIRDCFTALRMPMEPFHVKVIRALDRQYRSDIAAKPKQRAFAGSHG